MQTMTAPTPTPAAAHAAEAAPTKPAHASLAYRPDIDGLRAVAVVAVVLYHAGLKVPGGFVGVDVFFVISGYLITALILKDLAAGTFSLGNFWERRVRRIAPALLAAVAATAVAAWFILIPEERKTFGGSLVAVVACVANVFFRRNTGYFDAAADEMPLLHTWSLAVEEQFYIVVPLVLLLLAKLGWFKRVFPVLVVAGVLSLLWAIHQTDRARTAAFFLLPSRAWELIAGALLAVAPWRPSGVWRHLCAWGGMLAIAASCLLYSHRTVFPGLMAIPPVAGAALFMWAGAGHGPRPLINRIIAWRPIVFVGLISYSLYLWHWPVLVFGRYFDVATPSLPMRLAMVAASFALAIASWWFVERPFRVKAVFATRRPLFAAAIVAYAVVALVGLAFQSKPATSNTAMPPLAAQILETSKMEPRFRRSVKLEDVPDNLIRLGKAEGDMRLIVWGDSHAMSVLPPFDALCDDYGIAGAAAAHSQSPPAMDFVSRGAAFGLGDRAPAWNEAVVKLVRDRGVRVVVMAGFWQSYVGRGDGHEIGEALLKSVDAMRAAGASVYFLTDVPVYDFDVRQALLRRSYRGLSLEPVAQTESQRLAWARFQTALAPKLTERGATVIDVTPTFVDGGPLVRPYDAGGSRYADKHHLSTYGAMRLKSLFEPIVKQAAEGASTRPTTP